MPPSPEKIYGNTQNHVDDNCITSELCQLAVALWTMIKMGRSPFRAIHTNIPILLKNLSQSFPGGCSKDAKK